MLTLKNIVKNYGVGETTVQALKGVSFDFRKSEFVSILGPSGCGKTTMLNIIGGLDRYTSGDLIIDGKSTKNYTDKDWDAYRNNRIGFVFQTYNLIPHQTVIGNVELALELSGISKTERRNRALNMLERVGLKDQAFKKPNQLSGGQMQRVAIARALINNPEIILADEPTGALDTETSIQIMEILKEISKEKLVIMVTHNPELAEKYSTRIIKLLDGEMLADSNPFIDQTEKNAKTERKPKMGFKTALGLSLKNLFSKKARTVLTSVAGSIGIIGVALVLALSNGFNKYMARMQTDSLATYPLTISESSVDLSNAAKIYETELKNKYPELDNIFVQKGFDNFAGMLKSNIINDNSKDGFLTYLNNLDPELYYAINYTYGFDMNSYIFTDITLNGQKRFTSIGRVTGELEKTFDDKIQSAMGGMMGASVIRQYIPTIKEIPSGDLIQTQYDMLWGKWPNFANAEEGAKQLLLVVDPYNGISDITLTLLGYMNCDINEETNDFTFEEIQNGISLEDMVGKKFYLGANEDNYDITAMAIAEKAESDLDKTNMQELEIVGVIRAKENVTGILDYGIAYTSHLTQKVLNENKDGDVAQKIKELAENPLLQGQQAVFKAMLRGVAAVDTPSNISIYAKDFNSKESIKEYLDAWNDNLPKDDEKRVAYSDMMSMMFGMLGTMVDAVTYVLIAFTSISLVVSSVMISIITYTSVVERTKEIGVLRSLGASKKEISSVFNAETFLIGLFSGVIGVVVTYLLSIPINLILGLLVADIGKIAVLNPLSALALIIISVLLTLIAGLIPARIAAKKDPVIALRTE